MRLLACLALLACPQLAFAAPLPVQNASFAEWTDGESAPRAWGFRRTEGFTMAKECAVRSPEAGCTLRIVGQPGAAGFQSLGQSAHPGASAGHGAILSARVRTRDVAGRAALWLRVDGPGGTMLALENMDKRPLSGTRDWERIEIRVPVAPNAQSIAFGVFLMGSGSAWFTDLALEEDLSVDTTSPPPRPPRAQPPRALLDDAALRLAEAAIPSVEAAWKAEIAASAHPIRSLVSDDFSDLAFLEPLLRGRRVVQLGESSHGIAEFNWMKVRLVKYLHERLGYDVIAFESSMAGCEIANGRLQSASAEDAMRDCIFGVWHTDEVLPLFEYLKSTRQGAHPMTLAGFDTQNSGRAARDVDAMLVTAARHRGDAGLASRVEEANRNLRRGLGADEAARHESAYEELARRLERGEAAQRAARARAIYVRQLAASDFRKGGVARDRGMADLLDELLDRMDPDRKVIVWAHNFHIAKVAQDGERMMGSWVAERRGREVYTIGLYMGRGTGSMNDRKLYDIARPPAGSLEAVMASAGWRMSFVDLTKAREGGWADAELVAREWGTRHARLVPRKAYDAILYIDEVTPPAYR